MFAKQNLFQICILSFVILGAECWRPFKIEISDVHTYSFVDFMETNSSISNNSSVTIYINMIKHLPTFYAKGTVTLNPKNGNHDLVLFNKTVDGCEFLKNPKYESIVQVFYRALTKNGSFPKSCPLTKKLYFVRDVFIDPNNFPPLMPYKGASFLVNFMVKNGDTFDTIGGFKMNSKIRQ